MWGFHNIIPPSLNIVDTNYRGENIEITLQPTGNMNFCWGLASDLNSEIKHQAHEHQRKATSA
uniref:Uncharacterized protein n=1 Tax=Anguilla anguilla TaxID=7936 RepID=A0A0E9S825_ANGAN